MDTYQAYDELMALNEASDSVANSLTDAGMGTANYGLSFGRKQFDLVKNPQAKGVLAEVIKAGGGSEADRNAVLRGDLAVTPAAIRADKARSELVDRINAVMSTPAARTKLEALTSPLMRTDVDGVESYLATLLAAPSWTFLSRGKFGRLCVLDYRNFIGQPHAGLTAYFKGGIFDAYVDAPPVIGEWSYRHLVIAFLSTLQGSLGEEARRPNMLYRVNNILRVSKAAGDAIELNAEDRAYFAGPLSEIIEKGIAASEPGKRFAAGNSFIKKERDRGGYKELQRLAKDGRL